MSHCICYTARSQICQLGGKEPRLEGVVSASNMNRTEESIGETGMREDELMDEPGKTIRRRRVSRQWNQNSVEERKELMFLIEEFAMQRREFIRRKFDLTEDDDDEVRRRGRYDR